MSTTVGMAKISTAGRRAAASASFSGARRAAAVRAASTAASVQAGGGEGQQQQQGQGGGPRKRVISCSRIFSSMATDAYAASSSSSVSTIGGSGLIDDLTGTGKGIGAVTAGRLRRRDFSAAATAADLTFDEQCIAEDETSIMATPPPPPDVCSSMDCVGAEADPYLTEILSSNDITLEELTSLASLRTTPLSLANMYRYASLSSSVDSKCYDAQRLRNAQFLHRELPIRIAQRSVDLLTLPHGLNHTRQVRSVTGIYLKYLRKFRDTPSPRNAEDEERFTDMLHELVLDRTSIPSSIARGIAELRDARREDLDLRRLREMEDALYRFFTARVGLRFLTEHHVLSARGRGDRNDELRRRQSCLDYNGAEEWGVSSADEPEGAQQEEEHPGCIQKNCDPVLQARRVAAQVTRHCRECYGVSPDVEIVDCTDAADADVDFTYVPHHLQYMLAELLKNSCRATVRRYLSGEVTQEDHTSLHTILDRPVDSFKSTFSAATGIKPSASAHAEGITPGPSLPPIRVIIVKGAEDVTIKVADRAGGLPRTALRKIWSFAHTTNGVDFPSPSDDRHHHQQHHHHSHSHGHNGSGQHRLHQQRGADNRFEIDEFTGGADVRGFGLPLARIYARYFGGELTVKSMEGHGVDAYLYLPVLGSSCENLPQSVLSSPGNLDSTPGQGGGGGDGKRDDAENDASNVVDEEMEASRYDGAMNRHDDFWTPELGSGRGDGITHAGAMDLLARRALSR